MIHGMLARKIGMTQIFIDDEAMGVTVFSAGPCFVVQKKTAESDGYDAIQLGFIEKSKRRVNKAMMGHFVKAGTPSFYRLGEFKGDDLGKYKVGQKVTCADIFEKNDYLDVMGISKGKGFTGVMKRWNFAGGPASHGSMHNRAPGSIGQSSNPSKVFKGMKMPGHSGNSRVTVQNLRIVDMLPEKDILIVKGSVPGPINSVVRVMKAVKKNDNGI